MDASPPQHQAAVTTQYHDLHSSTDDKGKIERFFRTLRAAWLSRLGDEDTKGLEALNRSLWAWVEGEYHQSPHRGLDARTPLDQWALAGHTVRYPDPTLDLGLAGRSALRREHEPGIQVASRPAASVGGGATVRTIVCAIEVNSSPMPESPATQATVEVELCNGHRVSVTGSFDVEALCRLVRGLAR